MNDRTIPTSSAYLADYAVRIEFSPSSRRAVRWSAGVLYVAAAFVALHSAVAAWLKGLLLTAAALDCCVSIARQALGGRCMVRARISASGEVRVQGRDGWRSASLLPGSFMLGSMAWLRLASAGRRTGELITRKNCGERTWRRLAVVWRYRARHESLRLP